MSNRDVLNTKSSSLFFLVFGLFLTKGVVVPRGQCFVQSSLRFSSVTPLQRRDGAFDVHKSQIKRPTTLGTRPTVWLGYRSHKSEAVLYSRGRRRDGDDDDDEEFSPENSPENSPVEQEDWRDFRAKLVMREKHMSSSSPPRYEKQSKRTGRKGHRYSYSY